MIIDDSGSDRIRHTFIASIRYQPDKKGQALKQAEKIRASPLGRLRSEEAINPMAAGNNRTAPDATLNLLNGLALVRRATMKSIITPNSLGDQSLYGRN
jgi:hypothetical protein